MTAPTRFVQIAAIALLLIAVGAGLVAYTALGTGSPTRASPPVPTAPSVGVATMPAVPGGGSNLPSGQPAATASPKPSTSPVPTLPPFVRIGFTLHVSVLTYHVVATPAESVGDLPGLVVSPALFDAQLTRLQAAGWHTVTLGALAADLAAHRRLPPRSFVITIDDGHVDGYTEAFPILRRHAMVATYFVIAGRIGHPGYLDAGQLRGLAAAGMEIGDHSMDHVDLAAVAPAELAIEVAGAAAVLQTVVGTAPVTFAYPFGEFDAAVARAVARAGLLMAVTTRFGAMEAANLRYEIPRVRVGPWTRPETLLATLIGLSG